MPSSPSPVRAIAKEIVAATNNILASKSSNYSLIFSQSDSSSSFSNSLYPYFSSAALAFGSVKPAVLFV